MLLQSGIVSLDVNPMGAWITRLQVGATHFFYPRELVDVDGDVGEVLKFRGGCHVCSPVFGKANEGSEDIPYHGGLREMEWKSYLHTDGMSASFRRRYVRTGYDLDYLVTSEIVSDSLLLTARIKNNWRKAPPRFELAWHPYLNAPEGATVNLPNGRKIDVCGPFAAQIMPWSDGPIQVILPGIGVVNYHTSGTHPFRHICIWTDMLRSYVCVEPLIFDPKQNPTIGRGEEILSKLWVSFTRT